MPIHDVTEELVEAAKEAAIHRKTSQKLLSWAQTKYRSKIGRASGAQLLSQAVSYGLGKIPLVGQEVSMMYDQVSDAGIRTVLEKTKNKQFRKYCIGSETDLKDSVTGEMALRAFDNPLSDIKDSLEKIQTLIDEADNLPSPLRNCGECGAALTHYARLFAKIIVMQGKIDGLKEFLVLLERDVDEYLEQTSQTYDEVLGAVDTFLTQKHGDGCCSEYKANNSYYKMFNNCCVRNEGALDSIKGESDDDLKPVEKRGIFDKLGSLGRKPK